MQLLDMHRFFWKSVDTVQVGHMVETCHTLYMVDGLQTLHTVETVQVFRTVDIVDTVIRFSGCWIVFLAATRQSREKKGFFLRERERERERALPFA